MKWVFAGLVLAAFVCVVIASLPAAVMQGGDDDPRLYMRQMAGAAEVVVIGTTDETSVSQEKGTDKIIGTAEVVVVAVLKGSLKKGDKLTVTYVALDPKNPAGGIFSPRGKPHIYFLKKGEKKDAYEPVHKKFGILRATASNIRFAEKVLKVKIDLPGEEKAEAGRVTRPTDYKYAIVVSAATKSDASWGKVVEKLKSKYKKSKLFTYSSSIDEVKQAVAKYYPRYVCFVAKPTDAGRSFCRSVISFMRTLDDDPYEDAVWAILTGYDVGDAMRIATDRELTVEYGLLHASGGWLNWFKEGLYFSEGTRGNGSVKKPGKPSKKIDAPRDTTQAFVKAVNKNKVHLIITSGHATERDWQMGYPRWGGKIMVAGGGSLVGRENLGRGASYPIKTTNPKIYYSWGNCLIAHINGMNCMCLAWIHNGCNHFYGHIITQSRQCTAPGIGHYFFTLQDRFTFAEAAYITRQAARFTQAPGYERCLGGTVLYGDPAYQARMAKSVKPAYDQELTVKPLGDEKYKVTFKIRANREVSFSPRHGGAAVAFLPGRAVSWSDIKSDCKTEITDNLVIMKIDGKLKKGDVRKVTFTVKGKGFKKQTGKSKKEEEEKETKKAGEDKKP